MYPYQVNLSLHVLNHVVNDVILTRKINNFNIIASLKSKLTCKMIIRIPVLHLLISSLPDSAWKTHVELLKI